MPCNWSSSCIHIGPIGLRFLLLDVVRTMQHFICVVLFQKNEARMPVQYPTIAEALFSDSGNDVYGERKFLC